jgi:hypothetical protein
VAACAPDPDLADTQRCTVTLDTLALTLRPDFDEPVLEGATIELASPVVTQEGWSFTGLGGARTNVTGTLTVAGRDGGAPTRYALDSFELEFDYLSSRSFLDLDARKPGW